jgi:hypothetical protein
MKAAIEFDYNPDRRASDANARLSSTCSPRSTVQVLRRLYEPDFSHHHSGVCRGSRQALLRPKRWGMLERRTDAADLAAIQKLNQEDIEATLAQDPKRLIDLWAENAVAFYPGSPPAVGKQAIGAHNEKFHPGTRA